MALSAEAIRRGDIPGVQLRCRGCVPAGSGETWRRLTEPAGLRLWLASEVEAGASAAADLELAFATGSDAPGKVELRTLEISPGTRWVVAWEEREAGWPVATRLTFALGGDTAGCRPAETPVSVFQQGFEHLPLSDCLTIWERYRRFWRAALDRLAAV